MEAHDQNRPKLSPSQRTVLAEAIAKFNQGAAQAAAVSALLQSAQSAKIDPATASALLLAAKQTIEFGQEILRVQAEELQRHLGEHPAGHPAHPDALSPAKQPAL